MIKYQYQRPNKTYQETLSNEDIQDKLKNYKKTNNVSNIPIGTHIRYFITDPKTNDNVFRLGGNLHKIDSQGRYITLSNGTLNWSVQLNSSILYYKMNDDEIHDELKNEIKKELLTEQSNIIKKKNNNLIGGTDNNIDNSIEDINNLKKQNKFLSKKVEDYNNLELKYNDLLKKNNHLTSKLEKIENEIKKRKNIK